MKQIGLNANQITGLAHRIIMNANKEAEIAKIKGIKPIHIIMGCFKNKDNRFRSILTKNPKIMYEDFLPNKKLVNLKRYYKKYYRTSGFAAIWYRLACDVKTGKKKKMTGKDILIETLKLAEIQDILGEILVNKLIKTLAKTKIYENSKTEEVKGNPETLRKEMKTGKVKAIIERYHEKYKVYLGSDRRIFAVGKTSQKAVDNLKKKIIKIKQQKSKTEGSAI